LGSFCRMTRVTDRFDWQSLATQHRLLYVCT
jgi:hypothetical protein